MIIPSKELGHIPFTPMLGTQAFLHQEIEAGLAEGIHSFVVLKGGRQIGGSTYMDALSLWWLQTYSGMVGMMVSDTDDNRDYRRDVMIEMLESLPRTHRYKTRRNNPIMLAWAPNKGTDYRGSRLVFAAAGKRKDSNLGRSKGLNFSYNDEIGSWLDADAYSSIRAAQAKRHPLRLYVDISTARGVGTVFQEIWATAQKALTQKAIFVSCWRDTNNAIRAEQAELWERYAIAPPGEDERHWIKEVKRRYGVALSREFIAWYRYMLAEEFRGDEVMMAQEFGILPEECFQAAGEKFISPRTIKRLQRGMPKAPTPTGYRYRWARYITDVRVERVAAEDAELRVWEEPTPMAAYVVACHPRLSTSDRARESVVQVCRVWPDRLRLVAEYATEDAQGYQLAWASLHMRAAYQTQYTTPYFIVEVSLTGQHVMAELQRMENTGYGLPPNLEGGERNRILNMMAGIHYLYRRLDTFTGPNAQGVKIGNSPDMRARVLDGLADELEREHVECWSPETIEQLQMLRRGEKGDDDEVGGGGGSEESRALCLAMAVESWLNAMGNLTSLVAPQESEGTPGRVEEYLVANTLPWMTGGR